ncbi:ArsR family transcriptional regulator [Natronobacillus azotifigens]|uniref:Metalloregulator ArsR/SmtB family transcription factor n=1 Tax=Natronobacillus azotifigens TaxID=472978 RepID=A0A9J6R9Q1_9BACI|nr:metalloregulator ArsR/SmtB family transcription factor [Natronobacillus azotifigens]MCZ0702279.1 metalloregulator ArsR/SmtB family transcription factor [Natronobacillus azotifigens]
MDEQEGNKQLICSDETIHNDIVDYVESVLNVSEDYNTISEIFKVLGNPTRLKIVRILREAEVCVHDLAHLLSVEQSIVSNHLKVLKRTNLVKYRRDGKIVYYQLADHHVVEILDLAFQHASEGTS